MREELVRTDEENQRYRQLIQDNRQRRQQLSLQNSPARSSIASQVCFSVTGNSASARPKPYPHFWFKAVTTKNDILEDTDRTHLSDLVAAYETHCLQPYIQRRSTVYNECLALSEDLPSKVEHHARTTINNITSLISFLSSIPAVQYLPHADRAYLCQHNIRPLILLNLHELDQLCFSEPYQVKIVVSLFNQMIYWSFRSLPRSRVRIIHSNISVVQSFTPISFRQRIESNKS